MILRHAFDPVDNARLAHLCGPLDAHLQHIEEHLNVRLRRRDAQLRIDGPAAAARLALAVLMRLYSQSQREVAPQAVQLALMEAVAGPAGNADARAIAHASAELNAPLLHTRRADLRARTPTQAQYLNHIAAHDITFGIGPAGTGKTYLAVACAVDALERRAVQRIILTRPAVEAGERLGFLPGDLAQKVDPYLRPLYDALYDLMGFERVGQAFEKGLLEIAPLAFMRGRTLNHAFVILDEAQNTTPEQMKMFLTRIGFGSRAVVTGDTSQVDLPRGQPSGLAQAAALLASVRGIATTPFSAADVVRHPLVARIVLAYEAAEAARALVPPEPRSMARR